MNNPIDGERLQIFARDKIDHISDIYLTDPVTPPYSKVRYSKAFPLLTQGWVHQERLLSPRLIHFGPQEISWECRTALYCECRDPDAHLSASKKSLHCPATVSQSELQRRAIDIRIWHDMEAPSWSWAAVENEVSWDDQQKNLLIHAKVHAIEIYSKSSIPKIPGPIYSGSRGALVIESKLVELTVIQAADYDERCDPGDLSIEKNGLHAGRYIFFDDLFWQEACAYPLSPGSLVYCLLIATSERKNGLHWEYSLVLRCLSEKERVYDRIGLFTGPELLDENSEQVRDKRSWYDGVETRIIAIR
jgi:hypothetical protein